VSWRKHEGYESSEDEGVCAAGLPSTKGTSLRRVGTYLRTFCTSMPATMPMVVGRLAAHTPSRLSVFSSMPEATMSGGRHSKHAVRPGSSVWMWPETASSDTPLSIHACPSSVHAWLTDVRAAKLSTQLSTRSTRFPPSPPFCILSRKCSKLATVVMSYV